VGLGRARRFRSDPSPMSSPIPGRNEVLLSSLVFVAASLLLLLEFTSIGYGWPVASSSVRAWNWLGALSCVGWFVGFGLLIDWIVFSTFPAWGFDRQALLGAVLKLIASVLFCVQPMSYLAGWLASSSGEECGGAPWSNFVGICFFHAGNMINAVGMLKLINRPVLTLANAPPFGMLIFASATWFLVVADGIYYFSLAPPCGPGVDVGSSADFVSPGQVIGAMLLLLGSVVYTVWAAALGPSKPDPLMAILPMDAR